MFKHTQTTADELFECVWPFCGLVLKGVKTQSLQCRCVREMPFIKLISHVTSESWADHKEKQLKNSIKRWGKKGFHKCIINKFKKFQKTFRKARMVVSCFNEVLAGRFASLLLKALSQVFLKEFSEIVRNSYFSKQLHDWKGKRVITQS